MKWNRKQVGFTIVLIVVTVLLCELMLQIAALVLAKNEAIRFQPVPLQVEDAVLGVRGNPSHLGHDQRGFRNSSVPERASVVALGDSQTYGVGVYPDEAWPMQFVQMTGLSTYSMAFGSYGPAHSLVLLEEALNLRPKLVIEAFYSGNDLFDSYLLVHKRGQVPKLGSKSNEVLQRLAEAERAGSIEDKVVDLVASALNWTRRPPPPRQTHTDELAERYELVRLGRDLVRLVTGSRELTRHDPGQFDDVYWQFVRELSLEHAGHRMIFERGNLRTVFTPPYRLLGLDLQDPRIEEGLAISLRAIEAMNVRLSSTGIPFFVLLVPTKEMVFKPVVPAEELNRSESYGSLLENEEEVWRRTKITLRNLRIPYVDALPVLQKLVQEGLQPYPVTWDGHMNVNGHRAVARLVKTSIPNIAPSLAALQD